MLARKSGLPPELTVLDRLMTRWARWARKQLSEVGWPASSMTAKMIEWHERGLEPEKLYPAGSTDKAPEGVMFIDRCVARLPVKLRACVFEEYFSGGPSENKARRCGLSRLSYRQNITSALWVIYAKVEAELEL